MHPEAGSEDFAAQRSPTAWPKQAVHGLMVLVPLALVFLAVYAYVCVAADRDLQGVIVEADRLDPGWQWDDLEAKRAVIPDAENGALRVLEAERLLPTHPWPPPLADSPDGMVLSLPPAAQLDETQTKELHASLQKAAPALTAARALIGLPRGRYPMSWPLDALSTNYTCQHAREVATLLQLEADLLAQKHDADGALSLGRAIVNAGRSIGDEPAIISQLVRMSCQSSAMASMERTLAQGQPTEQPLAAAQRTVEEEASEPLLLIGLRGERAAQHRMLEAIETGELKFSQMSRAGGPGKTNGGWYNDFGGKVLMRRNHAPLLRLHTKGVEIAKLPVEEQSTAFHQVFVEQRGMPILVGLALPSLQRPAAAFHRQQARLRCTATALAAERYRRSKGRWPGSLSELVATRFIRAVPMDPYDGAPLRFRATPTGLVIYCTGPDREDNGGKLNRMNPEAEGYDMGFELWNVKQRRQPAMRTSDALNEITP
jgi:hypothetical protein